MTREKNIIYLARFVSMLFTPFYLPLCGLIILFTLSYLSLLPVGYRLQVLAVVYSFSVIAGSCALMYSLMKGTVAILFFFAVWVFFGLLFVLLHKKYRAFKKRGTSKS